MVSVLSFQTAGTGGANRPVAAGVASDGIFVWFGTNPTQFPTIAIGDRVEVTGSVSEFNGLTQITTPAKGSTGEGSGGDGSSGSNPYAANDGEGSGGSIDTRA